MTSPQVELMNRFLEAGISDIEQIEATESFYKLNRLMAYLQGWRDLTPAEFEIVSIVYRQENHWRIRSEMMNELMKVPSLDGQPERFDSARNLLDDDRRAFALFSDYAKSHGWSLLYTTTSRSPLEGWIVIALIGNEVISGKPAPTMIEAIVKAYLRQKFKEAFPGNVTG